MEQHTPISLIRIAAGYPESTINLLVTSVNVTYYSPVYFTDLRLGQVLNVVECHGGPETNWCQDWHSCIRHSGDPHIYK